MSYDPKCISYDPFKGSGGCSGLKSDTEVGGLGVQGVEHPTSYTLHSPPHTLHPTLYILRSAPKLTPCTLLPLPYTLDSVISPTPSFGTSSEPS